ncbi:MAG: holo-ACP synthase [Lachnospiraceae bacterium]|nr:holo-ACP synthase [Lachnospiraceae bacterium]
MILGIGTDIVQMIRIEKALQRNGFLERTYTGEEQRLIAGRPVCAAGNFAVKESVAKAFGTGFSCISLQEIEVLRKESGEPYVNLYGAAAQRFAEQKGSRIHVSISNEKEYAIAYVILERADD